MIWLSEICREKAIDLIMFYFDCNYEKAECFLEAMEDIKEYEAYL